MKNNVSLVVLLAVLGVTTAQSIMDILGVSDLRPSLNNTVSDEMLQKCINNGDTQAVMRARAAAASAEECFVYLNDQIDDMLHVVNVTDQTLIQEHCSTLSTQITNCTQSFNADVYPCYSDQHIAVCNVVEEMMKNLFNYVCKPEHLLAISNPGPVERECLMNSARNMLATCRQPKNEDSTNKKVEAFKRLFEPESCRRMKKTVECATRTFEVCKKPSELTITDVIVGIINSLGSAIPPCPEQTTLSSVNAIEA